MALILAFGLGTRPGSSARKKFILAFRSQRREPMESEHGAAARHALTENVSIGLIVVGQARQFEA